jgi:hypothetical protein
MNEQYEKIVMMKWETLFICLDCRSTEGITCEFAYLNYETHEGSWAVQSVLPGDIPTGLNHSIHVINFFKSRTDIMFCKTKC